MRHVPTLLKRELSAYFLRPMAYLLLLAFQLIAWLNFYQLVDELSVPRRGLSVRVEPLNLYITASMPFWIAILVAIPALTMRLVSEERRSGTIEALLTLPISEAEIVVAKWLAGVAMYFALLAPFFMYLPFLYYQGKYHFDVGPLVSLLTGLTTVGMMFVAIGLFFSALTKNQIIAAIWTFVVLFLLLILSLLTYQYASDRHASWIEAAAYLTILQQIQAFGSGQLDFRYLTLHLSVAVFMLYLATKMIQSCRQGA